MGFEVAYLQTHVQVKNVITKNSENRSSFRFYETKLSKNLWATPGSDMLIRMYCTGICTAKTLRPCICLNPDSMGNQHNTWSARRASGVPMSTQAPQLFGCLDGSNPNQNCAHIWRFPKIGVPLNHPF